MYTRFRDCRSVFAVIFVSAVCISSCFWSTFSQSKNEQGREEVVEFEIPLTEDLMREHGLLERVLLIYEEIIKRIDNKQPISINHLTSTFSIMETFVHNYHEHLEEEYIFPLFEKHKREVELTRTLRTQHAKGRKITAQLRKIVSKSKNGIMSHRQRRSIKNLLNMTVSMYFPHAAREDTVIFAQVREFLTEEEFKKLGELFDAVEHKLLGEGGFERMLKTIESIEKELGIYHLDYVTPSDITIDSNK